MYFFFFFWQSSLHFLNWEHSECLSAEISLLGCVSENLKVSYCSQVKIYKKCFGSVFHKNFQDSTIQFHSCTISSRGIWTQNFKVSRLFQNVLQRQVGRVYELSYGIVLAKIGLLVASLFLKNNATLAVILLGTTFEGIKLELIVNNICILYSYWKLEVM